MYAERELDSLGDVPEVSVGAESKQAIDDADSVKLGVLLVAQERVRDPDVDAVQSQPARRRRPATSIERKSTVVPRLSQVHAHRVILYGTSASINVT